MKKIKSLLVLALSGLALSACIAPNPMIVPNGNGDWYHPTPSSEESSQSSQPSSQESSQASSQASSQESSQQSSQPSSQQSSQGSSESSKQSSSKIRTLTITFFLDYANCDTSSPWFVLEAEIGGKVEIPSEKQPKTSDCPDPAFPTFLGWSEQPLLDSNEGIIDFATYKAPDQKYLSIYGIWVCNE